MESHKTLDKKVLYKTGDISQMIICSTPDPEEEETEAKVNVDEMSIAKKKELHKKFLYNHGSEWVDLQCSLISEMTLFIDSHSSTEEREEEKV